MLCYKHLLVEGGKREKNKILLDKYTDKQINKKKTLITVYTNAAYLKS